MAHTWKKTTAELTCSRTLMQGGTPVIVTGCCHLRIEPGGNITVRTWLLVSCSLCQLSKGKTWFRSYPILVSLTKHFAGKRRNRKKKSMWRCVFWQVYTLFQFLSVLFTPKRWTCNLKKKPTFYRHDLLQVPACCCCFCTFVHVYNWI